MSSKLPNGTKQIIVVIVCAGIVFVAYWGNYLPYQKSAAFIGALQKSSQITSLDGFKELVSGPLNQPSPVGHEEVVRNVGNILLNIVRGSNNPELTDQVVVYVEEIYAPIIARGKGMSYTQNLYLLGVINEVAYLQTENDKYLLAAEKYFTEGQRLGPNRPQFLYGLFDVYRIEGKLKELQSVVDQILTQWPNDTRTKQIYEEYLKNVESSAKGK